MFSQTPFLARFFKTPSDGEQHSSAENTSFSYPDSFSRAKGDLESEYFCLNVSRVEFALHALSLYTSTSFTLGVGQRAGERLG